MSRIVNQEYDLRSPEFDMLRLQSEQVFSYLVVDQVLRDVTPVLGWAGVMDQEKEEDQ